MKIAAKSANSANSVRGGTESANKLFRNARRVQQNYNGMYGYYGGGNNGGGEDMKEAWYLADYSLKMVSCLQGEQNYNYESGDVEPSTVLFRLCPKDSCSTNTTVGCDSGFGDFAVGINTFTEAYTETIKDSYNNGMQFYSNQYGEFNVEEYTKECRLFEEAEGQGQGQGYNGGYYNGGNNGGYQGGYNGYRSYAYIGLACTADGKGIRLASFSDEYCTQESAVSFADTHNGNELPYSEGGLVPETCMDCMTMNDNYEYEVSEMCKTTYEGASYKCEENMQSFNTYYGPNTRGCDFLGSKFPSSNAATTETTHKQVGGAMLAAEYIVLLVVAGMVGAGLVFFFTNKAIRARKQRGKSMKSDDGVFLGDEGGASPGFWNTGSIAGIVQTVKGSVQNAAVKVKGSVQDATVKVNAMNCGECSAYDKMDDDHSVKRYPSAEA